MVQAESALITSRRNFLVRALGFTAAGATVSVPIITMEDARQRMDFHAKAFEEACREYYVGGRLSFGNKLVDRMRVFDAKDGHALWYMHVEDPRQGA